jgi:hypothetical protein
VSTVGMRATRRVLTGIIAAVMVLGLAGCGGGDDDDENVLGSGARNADLVITDMGFQPDEDFEVPVGQEVVLRVANEDKRPHTFTLTFLDIEQEIPPGGTADIKIKAPEVPRDGFYSFYSKHYQAENGYFGKIRVVQ